MFEPSREFGERRTTRAGREQEAGQGLAEAKLGRVLDLLDICDEETWGSSVHIL